MSTSEIQLIAIEYRKYGKLLSMEYNKTFSQWLQQEMVQRGMSQADLARAAGVSRAAISNVINENREVGPELALSIARGLNLPPEEVFRKANILPPNKPVDPLTEEMIHLLNQLPEGDRQEFVDWLRFKAEQRKARHQRGNPAFGAAKE